MKSKTILCFIDYYLPARNAGGSVISMTNIIDKLGKKFIFLVVTRDRDISDNKQYSNVLIDEWNEVENAKVFYVSPANLSYTGISNILKDTHFDILYLNSFFSLKMTFYPILFNYFNYSKLMRIIVAPRGELSAGALKFKKIKKYLYIKLTIFLKLFKNVTWHASSLNEKKDIIYYFGGYEKKIQIAADLLSQLNLLHLPFYENEPRKPGPLRIIFLSRISPVKNLEYLLAALAHVKNYVDLSIYGPIEDLAYWNRCEKLIKNISSNISVSYKGVIEHTNVVNTFSKYDLFVFPTMGENFGHVIYESLASGTSVITSNNTPWTKNIEGVVYVTPLDDFRPWISLIETWAQFNIDEYLKKRKSCLAYARKHFRQKNAILLTEKLFLTA